MIKYDNFAFIVEKSNPILYTKKGKYFFSNIMVHLFDGVLCGLFLKVDKNEQNKVFQFYI